MRWVMTELAKAFEAKEVEKKWYDFWEQSGFFKADPASSKEAFSIVMPPPNVTGVLHMGHVLPNTLQDIMIRFWRMRGKETLWVPGTDHAGIATQMVVERELLRTTGKRRTQFSREEFVGEVWKWKEKSEGTIISQLKAQGCSCDWSSLRFTMDAGNNRAVRAAFKRLFDGGYIYRGDYLVNWDPVTGTALADDEVEYEDQKKELVSFAYPLEDGSGSVVIATSRPETMLGDTAVAVAPKDPRYKEMIGKNVILPLVGRKIPIIADDHIDPHFGSGAMKVTPAHDHNDYQIGLRHNLPMINIMTPDGKINEVGGEFAGMTMLDARAAIVKAMQAKGHFVKAEPYVTRIGLSYRSKAVIEPYLSKQWFVKLSQFKEPLRQAVEEKKTEIIPEQWKATYFHWIDNLRDWCISRQLWWGHQIPIWYNVKNPDVILCYDGEGLPEEVRANPEEWQQDHDVLDTWFSSGLWPFSTLGWPEQTREMKKFYPNSILMTGHDILFFWVARMMMMGSTLTEKLPFPQVFLNGLIYGKSYWRNNPEGGITYVTEEERKAYDLGKPVPKDVQCRWEKMSKSKGNVINPQEVIQEYGADAVRMALASSPVSNPQIDLDRRRFEELKNFANKVWNGARFVFMNLEGLTSDMLSKGINESLLTLEDRWILSRLSRTVDLVNKSLESYAFDTATNAAYEFFWNEFCAYYVEIIKPVLFGKQGTPQLKENKQKVLVVVLLQAIRLLHPMAPFITEELFQNLKMRFEGLGTSVELYTQEAIEALRSPACMKAPFPLPLKAPDTIAEAQFDVLSKCVFQIRNIRGEMQIPTTSATDLYFEIQEEKLRALIQANQHLITALVRVTKLSFEKPTTAHGSISNSDGIQLFIPMPKELMQQEKARLQKEELKLQEQIMKLDAQLQNEAFVAKAPPALVEKQRATLDGWRRELATVSERLQKC